MITRQFTLSGWGLTGSSGVLSVSRMGFAFSSTVTHALGPVTTRGKRPPAEIVTESERYMATVNTNTSPSTARAYHQIWRQHLAPVCSSAWLKDVETYHVQGWLDCIFQKPPWSGSNHREDWP